MKRLEFDGDLENGGGGKVSSYRKEIYLRHWNIPFWEPARTKQPITVPWVSRRLGAPLSHTIAAATTRVYSETKHPSLPLAGWMKVGKSNVNVY